MILKIITLFVLLSFIFGCHSTTNKKSETLTIIDSSQRCAMGIENTFSIPQQKVDSLLRRIFVCEVIIDNQKKAIKKQKDSIQQLNIFYFECTVNREKIYEELSQKITNLENKPLDSVRIFSAKNLRYFRIDSIQKYISEIKQQEALIVENQTPEYIKKIKQASVLMLKEPVKFEMIGTNIKNIYLNIFNAAKVDNYLLLGIRLLDVRQQLEEKNIKEFFNTENVVYTYAPNSKQQPYIVAFPFPVYHKKFVFVLQTKVATLQLSLNEKIFKN